METVLRGLDQMNKRRSGRGCVGHVLILGGHDVEILGLVACGGLVIFPPAEAGGYADVRMARCSILTSNLKAGNPSRVVSLSTSWPCSSLRLSFEGSRCMRWG